MKNYTIIPLFLLTHFQTGTAQSHYDNRLYNDNQRSEIGEIKTICPCEAAKFFNSRQSIMSNRPVVFSQNCPQYTLAYSNDSAYKGFSFADFFKRFKRKRKVVYAQGSHIIPLR